MTGRLAAAVARATVAELLPARLAQEGAAAPSRLELVDAVAVGGCCWLAVLVDDAGDSWAAPIVVEDGRARRARPGDRAAQALLERLAAPPAATGEPDRFRWLRVAAGPSVGGERAMGVDQTHESVVVGETAVVKWSVAAAASPAPRSLAHLHAVGFAAVPEPWGFVEHDGRLLVAVDRFLPGAVDGWTWCVQELGDDAVAGRPARTDWAGQLGRLVADLHLALATPSDVIGDPVTTAGREQVRGWHRRATAGLELAVAAVGDDDGGQLRARADRAAAAVDAMLDVEETPVIHAHGDLHVGQVLRWDGGMVVTDFDGNPVLAPTERGVPEPATRDVAGMVQSLDHVGRVVLRRVDGASEDVVLEWIGAAQDTFLHEYRAVLARTGRGHLLDERLLRAFAVEQECREYLYAIQHIPRWRYVPDAAFAALFPEE